MSASPRTRRLHYAALALGVSVRAVLLALGHDADFHGDERPYVYMGIAWSRLGVYLGALHWVWPPGYPAFLSFLFTVFQEHGLFAAKLIQVVGSAAIGASVISLATRTLSSRAGVIAGFLWAFYLPLAVYTHYVFTETAFTMLFLPAVCVYSHVFLDPRETRGTKPRLVTVGLLLGLSALVKEVGLAVAVLYVAGLLLLPRQAPFPRRAARAAVLGLAFLVPVLPWTLRNFEVYGRWVVGGTTLGQNMHMGFNRDYINHDYSDIVFRDVYDEDSFVFRTFIRPVNEPRWSRSQAPNIIDRSTENTRRGLAFARRHPGHMAQLGIKRLADWLAPINFFDRKLRFGKYEGTPLGGAGGKAVAFAAMGSTTLVIASAIPGFVLAARDAATRWVFLMSGLPFLCTLLVTSFSRYRVPVEPIFLVLASGFLAGAGRPWSRRSWLVAAVGWTLLATLWWLNSRELGFVVKRIVE